MNLEENVLKFEKVVRDRLAFLDVFDQVAINAMVGVYERSLKSSGVVSREQFYREYLAKNGKRRYSLDGGIDSSFYNKRRKTRTEPESFCSQARRNSSGCESPIAMSRKELHFSKGRKSKDELDGFYPASDDRDECHQCQNCEEDGRRSTAKKRKRLSESRGVCSMNDILVVDSSQCTNKCKTKTFFEFSENSSWKSRSYADDKWDKSVDREFCTPEREPTPLSTARCRRYKYDEECPYFDGSDKEYRYYDDGSDSDSPDGDYQNSPHYERRKVYKAPLKYEKEYYCSSFITNKYTLTQLMKMTLPLREPFSPSGTSFGYIDIRPKFKRKSVTPSKIKTPKLKSIVKFCSPEKVRSKYQYSETDQYYDPRLLSDSPPEKVYKTPLRYERKYYCSSFITRKYSYTQLSKMTLPMWVFFNEYDINMDSSVSSSEDSS